MSRPSYQEAVRRTWRHLERVPDARQLRMREMIRYACLAPSSHNTQCWRFLLDDASITIEPDLQRRCPVVDPDDHHLYVSLGCAAENLLQAASALGQAGAVEMADDVQGLRIALTDTPERRSPLFEAIPERQSSRCDYDGQHLAADELDVLAGAARDPDVDLLLLTDPGSVETVLESVLAGNSAQLADTAFVAELKSWLRFSGAEAVRTGDGLYAGSAGNPSVPRWIGSMLLPLLLTARRENDKYASQLRSSAGVAVFVARREDAKHWMAVGRSFERFALQATAMGIRTAHVNQPVEVSALRAAFAGAIGIPGRRPDLVIRFGRGPRMPSSLRRALQDVLVEI